MFILTAFALAVAPFTSVVGYRGNVMNSTSHQTITAVDSSPIIYEDILTFNSGNNGYYGEDKTNQYLSYFYLQNYEDTSISIPISIKYSVDSSYSWYSWSVLVDKQNNDFKCNLTLDLIINYSDMSYRFPTCYFYDSTIYNYTTGAITNHPFTPSTPLTISLSCRLLPSDLIESLGGYDEGYREGYQVGWDSGYDIGNSTGGGNAYQEGYNAGKADGISEGQHSGTAYNTGYTEGYNAGLSYSNRDFGFMSLFTGIADTPIMMMRSLFGFEIFGTTMLSVVLALFTGLVVIHLLKKIIK